MPAPRLVKVGDNGGFKKEDPVQITTGVADAGKIPAIADDGQLDESLISSDSVKQHEGVIDLDGGTY